MTEEFFELPDGIDVLIDKYFSKKKLTIKGTNKNELIIGGKKADKIYTGGGDDYVFSNSGNDTIFVNGAGAKQIFAEPNTGNDRITVTDKDATVTVNLDIPSNIVHQDIYGANNFNYYNAYPDDEDAFYTDFYPKQYVKTGDDLSIRYYSWYYDMYYNEYFGTNTLTITDYYKAENTVMDRLSILYGEGNYAITDLLSGFKYNHGYIFVYGDKKHNVVGTEEKDYIYGSNKKDVIVTGKGDDIVRPGKGDDEITLDNSGSKTVWIANGDGNDTIKFNPSNLSASLTLSYDPTAAVSYERVEGTDDLTVYSVYSSGSGIKTQQTLVQDYFKYNGESEFVSISTGYNNTVLYDDSNAGKLEQIKFKGTYEAEGTPLNKIYVGSKKADNFTVTGSNNTYVYAGGGNDTINVTDYVTVAVSGGAGSDRINVTMEHGIVNIYHATGDGNDTISLSEGSGTVFLHASVTNQSLDLFDSYYGSYFSSRFMFATGMGFKRDGDNLVMQVPGAKLTPEAVTIEDYFKEGSNVSNYDIRLQNLTINNDYNYSADTNYMQGQKLSDLLAIAPMWIQGVYDKSTKTTTYDYMAGYHSCFKYSGSGKAIMNGSTSDDYYLVKLTKKTNLLIDEQYTDSYGDNDLFLTHDKKSLRFFFNVDNNGNVCTNNESDLAYNLLIFDSKKSLTAGNIKKFLAGKDVSGAININNYFALNTDVEDPYCVGSGYCNIYASKNMTDSLIGNLTEDLGVYSDNFVYDIANQVAGWLEDHASKNYTDAFAVFESGNKADINSLLKVYTSYEINSGGGPK